MRKFEEQNYAYSAPILVMAHWVEKIIRETKSERKPSFFIIIERHVLGEKPPNCALWPVCESKRRLVPYDNIFPFSCKFQCSWHGWGKQEFDQGLDRSWASCHMLSLLFLGWGMEEIWGKKNSVRSWKPKWGRGQGRAVENLKTKAFTFEHKWGAAFLSK